MLYSIGAAIDHPLLAMPRKKALKWATHSPSAVAPMTWRELGDSIPKSARMPSPTATGSDQALS
jgi:hypothetical protein